MAFDVLDDADLAAKYPARSLEEHQRLVSDPPNEMLPAIIIDGYPIPLDWADLVSEPNSAARICAISKVYQGIRDIYDQDIEDENILGQSHPGRLLTIARQVSEDNQALRDLGLPCRFDEMFRVEQPAAEVTRGSLQQFIRKLLSTAVG